MLDCDAKNITKQAKTYEMSNGILIKKWFTFVLAKIPFDKNY